MQMNPDVRGRASAVWFTLAVVMFLAAAAYAVFAELTGSDLTDARDDVPLLVLGIAGVISIMGWWLDRTRRLAANEDAQHERERFELDLREREAEYQKNREQLESNLKDHEEALNRERYLRSHSEEAQRTEKNWRQDLQAEITRVYRERGSLGDPSDIPSMVLRLAKTLLKAEKGLLLWQQDEDEEGKLLKLAAAEGFEQDPESSTIAQRFAGEALERDQAIREQKPGEVDTEQQAEADEEIKNLVAIPIYLQDEFSGVVVCANNPDGFDDYDDEVLLSVGDQAGAVLHNARLQGDLRASYLATVRVLADAIEVKDPLLRGHSDEVSSYVAAIADRFDLSQRRREQLLFGSLLHDIGKIGISERILLKPAALTPEERSVIQLHPRIGCRLVEQVPALEPISRAILHHHERFDGGGYPSGLKGEEIPLEARIICVADAFNAMIVDRPYRERMTLDNAFAELERNAGTQFDPEIVHIFVEEVMHNPPVLERQTLAATPSDPELETLRSDDLPILGHDTLALIDNLTLLYTRRYFHETAYAEAQRAKARGRPFGVVLVELIGVAELNWRQGYTAGDDAIRTAARTVQKAAARRGGTAYRYGGNRLGLIVSDTDERAVELLVDEVLVSLSFGSSVVATAVWHPGDDGEAVIARARARLDHRQSPER